MQEKITGEIDLSDNEFHLVQRLMGFFYSFDYSAYTAEEEQNESSSVSSSSNFDLHAEMYAIANKYQVPSLAQIALQKYTEQMYKDCSLGDFLGSISKIYELTPAHHRELRDVAVERTRRYMGKIQTDDQNRRTFRRVVQDVPDYAADLLHSYIDAPIRGCCRRCGPHLKAEVMRLKCPTCGKSGISAE